MSVPGLVRFGSEADVPPDQCHIGFDPNPTLMQRNLRENMLKRHAVVARSLLWSRMEMWMPQLDPSHIMQVGMGFFASKALLSAVELGLFTELAKQPMTGAEIARTLGLSTRAVPDFPDSLVALKFLERAGDGPDAHYSNTSESAMFLDRQSPGYIGGILEMANARLYRFRP